MSTFSREETALAERNAEEAQASGDATWAAWAAYLLTVAKWRAEQRKRRPWLGLEAAEVYMDTWRFRLRLTELAKPPRGEQHL